MNAAANGFDDIADLYQEVIRDRGRRPHHAQRLEVFDATAKGDNPMCGDRVELWLRRDPLGAIAQIGFQARGCAISIASADLMADAVQGCTAAEANALGAEFARLVQQGECPDCSARLDGLRPLSAVHEFPSRVKCATLPWQALRAALASELPQEAT